MGCFSQGQEKKIKAFHIEDQVSSMVHYPLSVKNKLESFVNILLVNLR